MTHLTASTWRQQLEADSVCTLASTEPVSTLQSVTVCNVLWNQVWNWFLLKRIYIKDCNCLCNYLLKTVFIIMHNKRNMLLFKLNCRFCLDPVYYRSGKIILHVTQWHISHMLCVTQWLNIRENYQRQHHHAHLDMVLAYCVNPLFQIWLVLWTSALRFQVLGKVCRLLAGPSPKHRHMDWSSRYHL